MRLQRCAVVCCQLHLLAPLGACTSRILCTLINENFIWSLHIIVKWKRACARVTHSNSLFWLRNCHAGISSAPRVLPSCHTSSRPHSLQVHWLMQPSYRGATRLQAAAPGVAPTRQCPHNRQEELTAATDAPSIIHAICVEFYYICLEDRACLRSAAPLPLLLGEA